MMKRAAFFLITTFFLGAVMVALGGCAGTTQPSKFYILSALPQPEASALMTIENADALIGIGPINLPAYLNRSQIVTRASDNELKLAEFHLWAEPLNDNIARVLMESLSDLLNTNKITVWRAGNRATYQITLDVVRFDVGSDGNAVLNVFWAIYGQDGMGKLFNKKSIFRVPAGSGDYQAIVAAQNRAIMELSREIASAIKRIHDR
jgi:uncharacterized lipoprotein YmbA